MFLELIGMIICFVMVGIIAYQAKVSEDEKAELSNDEETSNGGKFTGILFVLLASISNALS